MKRLYTLFILNLTLITSFVHADEALIARGDYLVNSIVACGNCHTPPAGPMQGVEFAGTMLLDEEPMTVFASNISPDQQTGIGNWSDAELIRAIREGIRPDGSLIGPPMPFGLYRQVSDEDMAAIVAYVRSVKPVSNAVPKSEYRIPLPPAWGPPAEPVAPVSTDDPVSYGEYLAGPLGHCIECHTPMVDGHFDFANQLGAGGFPFRGPWGISVSRNITPHPDKGIGNWGDDEIKRAITQGIRKDGSKLLPPMGYHYYANIKDSDLDAIVSYLRSLTPLGD